MVSRIFGSILRSGMYTLSLLNNNSVHLSVKYYDGSYNLAHKSEHRIKVENNRPNLAANAKMPIDGKHIGTFRISKSYCNIERSGYDNKKNKLIFVDKESKEGKSAKLDSIDIEKIIVKISRKVPCVKEVIYIYEKNTPYDFTTGPYDRQLQATYTSTSTSTSKPEHEPCDRQLNPAKKSTVGGNVLDNQFNVEFITTLCCQIILDFVMSEL